MENKIVLTEEQQTELKMLISSYEMLEKSKAEAELRGKEDSVRRINHAQNDTKQQILNLDPTYFDKIASKTEDDVVVNMLKNMEKEETLFDVLEKSGVLDESKVLKDNQTSEPIYTDIDTSVNMDFGIMDTDVQYDIIALPSKGQCYRSKNDRIAVAYLTAYDENLITSPNLYKDGLIIDFLLKHKVLDKNVDLDALCTGDVDAITLFLRATSYGPEFPIIVRDPESGTEIDSVVDLSQLKMKDFTLVGDENGHFEYELPVSKDKVKFRFLTRKDEKILARLAKLEEDGNRALSIKENIKFLNEAIKSDTILSGKEKQEYVNNLGKFNVWADKLSEKSPLPFSRTITNRLELAITSVNGNTDRKYISKYVKNMGAKDSLMLRRYIIENEPGINFEIEVQRPVSLGGGSFKTFLDWDDTVFINIA